MSRLSSLKRKLSSALTLQAAEDFDPYILWSGYKESWFGEPKETYWDVSFIGVKRSLGLGIDVEWAGREGCPDTIVFSLVFKIGPYSLMITKYNTYGALG